MSGALRPGTFIRLDETAAKLGVSATPVREALLKLRGEGMVQLEPHRGHVVLPLSRQDVDDIFWVQATIARELAASAAQRITDDEIDDLNREVFRIAVALGGDVDAREWAMRMTQVARAIERIGDNAVDIGEQVAFVVTGLFREFSDASTPGQF